MAVAEAVAEKVKLVSSTRWISDVLCCIQHLRFAVLTPPAAVTHTQLRKCRCECACVVVVVVVVVVVIFVVLRSSLRFEYKQW